MQSGRAWGIRFEYDATNDVVFVYPAGTITTADEAAEFHKECSAYYGSFGRKVDAVVNLEMLRIVRGADANQQSRSDIARKYIRFVVLVSDSIANMADANHRVAHDGVNYHAASNMEQAVALIKELRREAKLA